jgi:N6-adenosine-specific RNA methylase IME4
MSIDELCALKVPAAKDSVLYLWATASKLLEAEAVIAAWGYIYKTHAIWDKEKVGMGYWFRGQHELLMVGDSR